MFDAFDPLDMIARLLVLMFAFPVHEFAHAWAADRFGDDTPRRAGRLTLSPEVHLDLFGSLTLLLAGFGWARPVMIDPAKLRRASPSALMWVSLAGPLSNLLLAVVAAIPFRLGLVPLFVEDSTAMGVFSQILMSFVLINLLLLFFNLIPLAPLDGEKVLLHFLPPEMAYRFEQFRPYSPFVLMALLFLLPTMGIDPISQIIYPPMLFIFRLLVL